MSLEALAIVLNHSQARGTAKLVLLGIANHLGADSDQGAYPSQARLARYANVTDRAVRTALNELVDLGELRVQIHAGNGDPRYRPNRYWLELRCPGDCDRSMNHARVEETDLRQEETDSQGGRIMQPDRKQTSAEPVINRNKKPRENQSTSALLPEDWKPSEKDWQVMAEHFPGIDLKLETHAFRDYYQARGKKMRDWDATWRNWIRIAHRHTKRPGDTSAEILKRAIDG